MAQIALDTGGNSVYDPAEVLPAVVFTFPQTTGLVGAYIFTAGADFAAINLIENGPAPTIVGTVDLSPGYAVMSKDVGHLNTNIPETLEMTLFVVAKRAAAANTGFIGNFRDAANQGVGLYSLGAGQNVTGVSDRGATTGLSVNLPGLPDAWALYSVTVPATGGLTVRDHTAGTDITGTQTAAHVVESIGTIRIGALDPATTFGGVAHVAGGAVAPRVLTDAERTTVVEALRAVAAFGDIVV